MATAPPSRSDDTGERIAKVLARAGVASRRDAEKLIAQGRVAVDGQRLDTPARRVSPDQTITVDGEPIPTIQATRLFRFHKPTGALVTRRDPQGRPTVFEMLEPDHRQLIAIGRLDLNSEGLLLFTNDGELARRLELPATGWTRRYRVRAYGRLESTAVDKLAKGVRVDGERFGAIAVSLERQQGANAWLTVTLREGKNREVRRALEAVGLKVNRLIRIAYGPFQLGKLASGAIEEVPPKQVREQLGSSLGPQPAATRRTTRRANAPSGD